MFRDHAPPRSSPFRTVTDWLGDPWATAEEKLAWDRDRKARWIASLTEADWVRISETVDGMVSHLPLVALNDLEAPIRVGVLEPGFPVGSGVKFGTFRGFVLVAWAK